MPDKCCRIDINAVANRLKSNPFRAMTCPKHDSIVSSLRGGWLCPPCNPSISTGPREYTVPIIGNAAVVLYLLLSPTLVSPQTAVPDKPSGVAGERQTRQPGTTE